MNKEADALPATFIKIDGFTKNKRVMAVNK